MEEREQKEQEQQEEWLPRVIPVNFLQEIPKDMFGLMVETDKVLRAYNMTSIYMISDVMQSKSKLEALGHIVDALNDLRLQGDL